MKKRTLIAAIFLAALTCGAPIAPAQTPRPAPIPQSDVTLKTVAMRYPFDKEIKVPLVGTQRFASNVSGEALIERRKGVTLLTVKANRLPRPATVGPLSTAYVIWAITPEGIADNLGEFRKRGSDTLDGFFGSEVRTATRHRNFSLIITAEPHYLVASPSRLVVMTNQEVKDGRGVVAADNIISFSGDADVENKIVSPDPPGAGKDPKYPIELLQGRRAIDIARFYGADVQAPQILSAAQDALLRAEEAYRQDKGEEAAEIADTAVRLAERARRISVARRDAEKLRRQIEAKDDVIAEIQDRANQIPMLQAQLERERNLRREAETERTRNLDDYNKLSAEKRQSDANLEALREENRRLRSEKDAIQAKAKEAQINALREQLAREFEEARFEPRGSVLVMPDVYFNPTTPTQPGSLTAAAISKLDRLAEFLKLTNAALRIESFTDNGGTEEMRTEFCRERGQLVLSYLISRGIPSERMQAFSMGNANPRNQNKTPKDRQANRRIELIVPPTDAAPARAAQGGAGEDE